MGASKTATNVKVKSQKLPSPPSSVSGTQTSGSGEEKSRHACLQRQLRKTKFCVYHLQGVCHFGANCAFAHSCQEMQRVPDLRKTRICKAFLAGMCENEDCDFAHGEDELRSTDLCYKKTMCSWYEKGCCRNGDSCRFAHGIEELRSAPSTDTGSSPTDGITESGSNSSSSNDSSSRSNSSLKKDGSSKKDGSRKSQNGLSKTVNGSSTNGYHMNGVDDFKLSTKPTKAKDLGGHEQRRLKAGKAVVHDTPVGIEAPPGFPEASSFGNRDDDDALQSPASHNANNKVSSLDEPMKIEPATAFLGMDRGAQLAMQSLMANGGMGGFPNLGGSMSGFGSQVPDPLLGMLGMNASALAGLEAYPNSDEITSTLQGFRQQLESLEATHRSKMAGGEQHTLEKDLSSLINNLAALTNQMSHVEQQMRWNATAFNSAMATPGGTMSSNFLGLDYTPAPFPDSMDTMASEDWNGAVPNSNAERPAEWMPQSKHRFNQ